MPIWALTLLKTAGAALLSLASSLVTETFLKHAIIIGLEKVVKRTETDADDKLLQLAKKEWTNG
jgi:hypothetical protein